MEKPILKNELKVKIEGVQKITDNMSEVKEYALETKKYYENLVFTDEQIKAAKDERANINKAVKKVADYRKDIVDKFNKPLEEFVRNAKETENILKEASNSIDVQVKKYEEQEKETKKTECEELFNQLIGDLSELITFDKVFNPRWLNKTTKMIEVEQEIKSTIDKVNSGLNAIKELNSEFETEVTNTFLQDFDLSKAIMRNTQLKEQKERLAKTELAKEETKQEAIQEMISKPVETNEDEKDIIKSYTLKITANYTKLVALRKFMEINDIKFERVD
ncbi:MAG TPA: DUF1351 domain-containing protein [Candidatus Coprosoma intestinipullorum]|uniref:DUF1351 domain-containing protein n=1 Tax=Candidatus Coprosoma intestinipullorum TaxID=2840752 RepID=A0A9D1CYW6_9FIRM|nr:DUF1351 domain-containing protein [Candidatus Coprosoma intestinipullorum]